MSVSQYPPTNTAGRSFAFGSASTYTLPDTLPPGLYQFTTDASQSFINSQNALMLRSAEGYSSPVAMRAGRGYTTAPWIVNRMQVASLTTPTLLTFQRIDDAPVAPVVSSFGASYNASYSASYTINGTLPAGASVAYVYYTTGTRDVVNSFPASITSPAYNPYAVSASSMTVAVTYIDAYGRESLAATASALVPAVPGPLATGGSITTGAGYRYHTFRANGTFQVTFPGNIEYMVVAGGGGGGSTSTSPNNAGGGGGAGGVISGSLSSTASSYAVTIGGGGGGTGPYDQTGGTGNTSTFGGSASVQGGGGGGCGKCNGVAGASGGGAGGSGSTGGTGVSGIGSNGGGPSSGGGGGGGRSEAGNTDGAGAGGDGTNAFSAWATATTSGVGGFYAGGGAGGPGRTGGDGGGGNTTTAGTANTGGGGGGSILGYQGNLGGGGGGSGIVIVRYLYPF